MKQIVELTVLLAMKKVVEIAKVMRDHEELPAKCGSHTSDLAFGVVTNPIVPGRKAVGVVSEASQNHGVQASAIKSAGESKQTAWLPSFQGSDDQDDVRGVGAPAAAVHQSHSGSTIETLEDLKSKAEAELAETRQIQTNRTPEL